MTNTNFNFSDDLAQIRASQTTVLDQIDEIRERDGKLTGEIKKIQRDALTIVYEIDEIQQRQEEKQ